MQRARRNIQVTGNFIHADLLTKPAFDISDHPRCQVIASNGLMRTGSIPFGCAEPQRFVQCPQDRAAQSSVVDRSAVASVKCRFRQSAKNADKLDRQANGRVFGFQKATKGQRDAFFGQHGCLDHDSDSMPVAGNDAAIFTSWLEDGQMALFQCDSAENGRREIDDEIGPAAFYARVIDQPAVHPVIAEDHAAQINSPEPDADPAGFDLDRWRVATLQLFAKVIEIVKLARNQLFHSSPQKASKPYRG